MLGKSSTLSSGGNIPADSTLYDESDRALAEIFSDYFANFARTGDPTGRHMPKWLPYEAPTRYTMMIQYNSELKSNYRAKALELAYKLAGKRLPGFGKAKE